MEPGLLTTRVPRALDMKSKLFGYEMPDLLLIFMNLSLTSLLLGGTSVRYPLVWGTTLSLALFLHFVKRGKPDGYLQHLGELLGKPAYRSAGLRDERYRQFRKEHL